MDKVVDEKRERGMKGKEGKREENEKKMNKTGMGERKKEGSQ